MAVAAKPATVGVTYDAVRKAAEENPALKPKLEALFKEAFDGISPFLAVEGSFDGVKIGGSQNQIQVRNSTDPKTHGHAIYLSKSFDWQFYTDTEGQLCLVALKK